MKFDKVLGQKSPRFEINLTLFNCKCMYNVRSRQFQKYFVVKVMFSQSAIRRGSTETQSIGIQDVHNFIQY